MITITCTYNKLTRDYGTCRIDGAKNYKQARYATGGEPNYPVPATLMMVSFNPEDISLWEPVQWSGDGPTFGEVVIWD